MTREALRSSRRPAPRYMVMDDDVAAVESGGRTDFAYGDTQYPAATVDRVLHDGDSVRLGSTILIAHKTPGHTRGCTTWTMKILEGTRSLDVVIVGGWHVNPGYRLCKDQRESRFIPPASPRITSIPSQC